MPVRPSSKALSLAERPRSVWLVPPARLAPDRPATPSDQPWLRYRNSSRWDTGGTTAQALADYVALITALKKEYDTDAPVIAFGGSYGGMLAGWFRIARPDVITGSIAASAPVRMIVSPATIAFLPKKLEHSSDDAVGCCAQQASADTSNYKGGWEAIGRGMSKAGGATDNCFTNFRSVHQLAQFRECRRAVVSTTLVGRLWLVAAQLHTATMTGLV